MGFSQDQAVKALQVARNNIAVAADILMQFA
jgi:hypothetical protein